MSRPGKRNKIVRLNYRSLLVLVSTLMVAIFVVSLGLQYYRSIEDYISEKLITIEKSHLEQTGGNIDAQLNQIKNIVETIGNNDDMLNLISKYDGNDFSNNSKLKKSLEITLGKSANINRSIISIAIFTKENVITKGDIPLYDMNQSDIYAVSSMQALLSSKDREAVFIMPAVFENHADIPDKIGELLEQYSFGINLIKNGENIGTLFVLLGDDFFGDILPASRKNLVFGQDGRIIYNGTKQQDDLLSDMYADLKNDPENSLSIQNREEIMICSSSVGFGITVGFLLEKSDYMNRVNDVKGFFLIFILILLMVSFVLSSILAKIVIKPLKKLTTRVKKYNIAQKNYADDAPQHKRPRLSMRESIMIFLITVVMLSTSILIYSTYSFFSNIIDGFTEETTENAFNQTVENMNFYFNNIIHASESIAYADGVQSSLMQTRISDSEYYMLNNTIIRGLALYNAKAEISLFNKYGEEIISYFRRSNATPLNMKLGGFPSNYLFGQTQKDIDGSYYIPFYMKINNIDRYTTIGFFECRLSELDIENLYSNLSNDYSTVYVINEESVIVSHPNKNLIGTYADRNTQANDEEHRILRFEAPLKGTGLTIIETYENNTVVYDKTKFLLSEIYLLVIIMLTTFITAFLISRNLPSALVNLNNRINSINFNNLDMELEKTSPIDEVNQLNMAFNDMSVRIERLLKEVVESVNKANELEKTKNRAEINALQAQINPHFLYNTFENIHWMIRNDSKNEAMFMVKCLSSMLRFIAKREPIIVTIGEEIGYTKTYVEIMKKRYEDELEFEFQIDETLFDYKIIKLILQPVIENAIEHGVRPKGTNGKITVRGALVDQTAIEFIIHDDGIGISEEKLLHINAVLSGQSDPDTIGLKNVQERLHLFYGDLYGIHVISEENMGTSVILKIPAQKV